MTDAALRARTAIARVEKTTVSDLIRHGMRDTVRQRAANPKLAPRLQRLAENLAPLPPLRFRSAAQLARYKRAQREHDRLLLELGLAQTADVQARNSLTRSPQSVGVPNFATAQTDDSRP